MFRTLGERPTALVTFQVIFVQFFTIVVFAIQAPLIGPRAFGLVTLVMVVVGFCESVVTAVTTDTLISVRDIDDLHFATATTIAAAIAALLGAGMFIGSGIIGGVVGDPELSPVLRWMSVLPLLSALWAAPNAKTKREMQFRPTVIRSIASLGLSGLIGVALALLGAGVWALVFQALIHRSVGAVALWSVVPLRFRLAFSRSHFRELKQIALSLLAARCMSWASGQVPRFILGFHLGTVDLGLYGLGARLTDILVKLTIEPNTVIARISFRRFAADRFGLDRDVRRLFTRTSTIAFPLCAGGAAVAPILVSTWLGPRWQGGTVCMQVLLLACIPYVTYYGTTAILLALNQRRAEIVISTLQVLAVVAFVLVGARFGLNAAAAAIASALLVVLPVPLMLLKSRCEIPIGTTLGAQIPALIASMLMGASVWLIGRELGVFLRPTELLVALVGSGAVIYVLAICALTPALAREQVQALLGAVRSVTEAKGSPDVLRER